MSKDIECPYCGHEQNIIHDDGYGYMEDEVYNQQCCECKKTFIYTTFIFFDYDVKKADCLNDGKHEYYPTNTRPKCMTRMRCKHCADDPFAEPTEASPEKPKRGRKKKGVILEIDAA